MIQKLIKFFVGFQILGFDIFSRIFFNECKIKSQFESSNTEITPSEVDAIIIIPTKNNYKLVLNLIDSLIKYENINNIHVHIVSNNSDTSENASFQELTGKYKFVHLYIFNTEDFNFSRLNNWAVNKIKESYKLKSDTVILFLNNDIELVEKGSLSNLLNYLQIPEIGVVGNRLMYPNNTTQHSGIVFKRNFDTLHINQLNLSKEIYQDSKNYLVPAVTAAAMGVKYSDFVEVGGFDENLPVSFNDVDFCLKILQKGKKVLYVGGKPIIHYESYTRGLDSLSINKFQRNLIEFAYFKSKWKNFISEKYFK